MVETSQRRPGGLWAWVARTRGRRALLQGVALGLALGGAVLVAQRGETVSEGRHDGQTAIRVTPRTDAEREEVLAASLDVWSEHVGGEWVDVVVDEDGLQSLRARGVPLDVLVPDIQAVADAERERLEEAEVQSGAQWFTEYKNLRQVNAYLEELAETYPDLAELRKVGHSIEGRKMLGLRISGSSDSATELLVNGGQHAREWISVMVSTCVADRLLRGYANDPRIRNIVDRTEIFVVPVANPDGYDHSWSVDRYWRKNRREGHGVDLNRNYPVGFGGRGSSSNSRSQIYRGRHAFSEPESAALRDLFVAEDIDGHLDLHCYGQLMLHPWGYKGGDAPRRAELRALGDRMVTAMYAAHGKSYKLQAAGELYIAGGIMSDWAYGERDALSFVIELRPDRGVGFVLPPEEIVPTCDEGFAATLELAEWLLRREAE